MKVPPKGSQFEYKEFPRSEYLGHMLTRLDNEIGFYITLIENNPHPSGAGVGFLVRHKDDYARRRSACRG
jgi:hypothetical protein